MDSQALTCKELVALVTDYYEGVLSPADRERFEKHTHVCSDCHAYLEQMRLTIFLTGKLSESDLSADVSYELLHAFRKWKQSGTGDKETRDLQ